MDEGRQVAGRPVAIAQAADAEAAGDRTRQMLSLAREWSSLRDADADGGQTARLVEALAEVRAQHGERLAPAELLEALRRRPGWDGIGNTRRLAGLLNPLGLYRRQVWEIQRRRWVYLLDAEQLADLTARYGAGSLVGGEADGPSLGMDVRTDLMEAVKR